MPLQGKSNIFCLSIRKIVYVKQVFAFGFKALLESSYEFTKFLDHFFSPTPSSIILNQSVVHL